MKNTPLILAAPESLTPYPVTSIMILWALMLFFAFYTEPSWLTVSISLICYIATRLIDAREEQRK